MADSAYRMVGFPGVTSLVGRWTDGPGQVWTGGVTEAQMDEWAPVSGGGERNLRGWTLSFQRLQGMGGTHRYSDVESDIVTTGTGLDTDIWAQWRGIHWYDTDGIVAAMVARGMEPGITFWAANASTASGWQTPFARWERDDVWAATVIPQVRLFARAAAAEGFTTIGIDGELYSYQTGIYGDTHNTGWTGNYNGRTCTEAQGHTFARQRGREIADAILAEMPGASWWSYYTDLPGSNRALVHGSDTFYATNTSVDFLAGVCSNPGWSAVYIVDPSFYKGPQVWSSTPSFGNWCDAIRNGQMGAATTICSKLTDSEWDGVAAKLCFPPFIWLTPGATAYETRMPYATANNGVRAAVYAGAGGRWWLYTQASGQDIEETGDAVGTGYDYDEYEPIFAAYGDPAYGAEVSAPSVTITTDGGAGVGANYATAGDKLSLAGWAQGGPAAADSGGRHAIHYVTWSNSLTGASGQCRINYINDLIAAGDWDPTDVGAAPQNGQRLECHMNWSKPTTGDRPILLGFGANPITVTAVDVKGNTATDTITVTRTSGPPAVLVQSAAAEASAATSVTASLPGPATSGSLLVAQYWLSGGAANLLLTTVPSGFLIAGYVQNSTGTPTLAVYTRMAAGGEQSFQFSQTAAFNLSLCVMEFSGFQSASIDKLVTNDPAGAALTSCSTGTTGTLTNANELLIGGVGTSADNGGSEAVDSTFTLVQAGSLTRMLVGYKVVGVSTAENPSFSWATGREAAGLIVTFEDALAGGRASARARQVPHFTLGRTSVRTG